MDSRPQSSNVLQNNTVQGKTSGKYRAYFVANINNFVIIFFVIFVYRECVFLCAEDIIIQNTYSINYGTSFRDSTKQNRATSVFVPNNKLMSPIFDKTEKYGKRSFQLLFI